MRRDWGRTVQSTVLAALIGSGAGDALAQTPGAGSPSAAAGASAEPGTSVGTRTGHEVTVGIGGYTYIEPGDLRISIQGPKLALEYTGTRLLNERRRWLIEGSLHAGGGTVSYDGWCRPWLITPDGRSRNGYALGLGGASPCSSVAMRTRISKRACWSARICFPADGACPR